MIHTVTIAEIPDPMQYDKLSLEAAELISRTVYEGGELPEVILDGIEQDITTTVVAIDNTAKIIGAATFWLYGSNIYIGEIGVDVNAQNRGIGHQIVNRIEDLAIRQGAKAVRLTSGSTSTEGFWEHLGYSDDGEYFSKHLSRQ